jgi:hypothetical protein
MRPILIAGGPVVLEDGSSGSAGGTGRTGRVSGPA